MGVDTVEVWGSSPHVPTISFNHLPNPPPKNLGPLGSNKRSNSKETLIRTFSVSCGMNCFGRFTEPGLT